MNDTIVASAFKREGKLGKGKGNLVPYHQCLMPLFPQQRHVVPRKFRPF